MCTVHYYVHVIYVCTSWCGLQCSHCVCVCVCVCVQIDRLYDWFRNPHSSVKDTLKKQKPNTLDEFQERLKSVIGQLSEQSVNAALYWDKVDFGKVSWLVGGGEYAVLMLP